jgi:hypothetical protein
MASINIESTARDACSARAAELFMLDDSTSSDYSPFRPQFLRIFVPTWRKVGKSDK